jgi:8-oxo-dGTP pyrophosphatase MutT (NUDIX family)
VKPTLWFDAKHTHAAAGVVLVARDGRLILQLRDDIPEIDNPGKITPFGGSAERGETPVECALRELAEETGLQADPTELRLLDTVSKRDFRGNNTACVFYVLRNIDPASLKITEGTAIVLSFAQAAADPRLTPTCRSMTAMLTGESSTSS